MPGKPGVVDANAPSTGREWFVDNSNEVAGTGLGLAKASGGLSSAF